MEKKLRNNSGNFILGFIIFLTILIMVTICAIYFSIRYLEEKNERETKEIEIAEETEDDIIIKDTEKETEDSIYAIKSYTETYDINDIKITTYYDENGVIKTKEPMEPEITSFVEIEGLKDKQIQNGINARLKQEAYKIKGRTIVVSNFSNCLSVEILNQSKQSGLNINLATGEDIPFEELFIKSTPINSVLAQALYEKLAWQARYEAYDTDDEMMEEFDMSRVDTSSYEDKVLLLLNNYEKMKGNIKYNFSANQVDVYGLLDDRIIPNFNEYDNFITIDLSRWIDYVAIFKRYLTPDSIYLNNNVGQKNIIVYTNDYIASNSLQVVSYGKISDNIFLEESLLPIDEVTDAQKQIFEKIIMNFSANKKAELKSKFSNNTGVFYQVEYYVYKINDNCYEINCLPCQATCEFSYFQNEGFKDFIKMKNKFKSDATMHTFEEDDQEEFPNLKIKNFETEEFYYDKDGNFLGNDLEKIVASSQMN